MIQRPPISTLFPYMTLFRSIQLGRPFEGASRGRKCPCCSRSPQRRQRSAIRRREAIRLSRSEEHTSELQSRPHLVCRLLLEKKKTVTTVFLHHFIRHHVVPD